MMLQGMDNDQGDLEGSSGSIGGGGASRANTGTASMIDFIYTDTDTHVNEIAELYSYNEELDFVANRIAFEEAMEDYGFPLKWSHTTADQKGRAVERLAEGVEVTDRAARVRAIRSLLYLMQGNFADCLTIEEQPVNARKNIFTLYEYGLFPILVQMVHFEVDAALRLDPTISTVAPGSLPPPVGSITNAPNDPNSSLKLLISMLYLFVLEMSRQPEESPLSTTEEATTSTDPAATADTPQMTELRERFKEELSQPICGELLHLTLFEMVIKLCNGTGSRFPMKKILLLLWKILLLTLGGSEKLRELKNLYRVRAGLKAVPDDTLEVVRRMRPASPPPSAVEMIDSAHQRKLNRPFKRQTMVKQNSFGEENNNSNNNNNGNGNGNGGSYGSSGNYGNGDNGDDEIMNDEAFENGTGGGKLAKKDEEPRPGSPVPEDFGGVHRSEEAQLKQHFLINNKSLPWIPKVRQKEIDAFLAGVRRKFIGYALPEVDRTTTAGLPGPILESIDVLKRHLYESLAEAQMVREEEIFRYPLTSTEFDAEAAASFAETLYRTLLPSLPQYLISLLKLLLASVSSVKAKNEGANGAQGATSAAAANVLSDVGLMSSVPLNVSPGTSEQAASVLQSLKLKIDLNRHQEIIIKAISGILLLLLKHYKISHVYQFEYISQQLMFANAIPLVIKFISQEMAEFVTAKNTVPVLDFPACVIGEQPELTSDTIELLTETQPFCWRNLFSAINLLRILNKLTKWKNCRIMMLVLFKSAQPLKKSLRIRHAMFQVYALKLLKMQAKFLGRQWRKNNMKTMSAIYQKVRHRLNDDWAFANDVDSKQLYFQTEEFILQASINRFHNRRYEKPFPVANINSVTAQALSTSASSNSFKINEYGNAVAGGMACGTPSTPSIAGTNMFFDGVGWSSSGPPASGHQAPGVNPALAALAEADLFQPVDNNLQSVLSRPIDLTPEFKRNYEVWLEREVFRLKINWDELLGEEYLPPRLTTTIEPAVEPEVIQIDDDDESHSRGSSSGVLSGTATVLRRGSASAGGSIAAFNQSIAI